MHAYIGEHFKFRFCKLFNNMTRWETEPIHYKCKIYTFDNVPVGRTRLFNYYNNARIHQFMK